MDSGKFSFFDFITFLIPGGFFITVIWWFFGNYWDLGEFDENFYRSNSLFLIIPLIFIAYFFGHLINATGKVLERIYIPKFFWTDYLKSHPSNAELLNTYNKNIFHADFYKDNGKNKEIDPRLSGEFFDSVYNYLQITQKSDLVAVLMGQYTFFTCLTGIVYPFSFCLS